MPAFSVPLSELAATLKMDTIYAPKELSDIPIYTADVNRPGIMLAGYYQYFDASRIQICGMVEISYLKELPEADRRRHLEKMLSLKPPAVIISRGLEVLPEFLEFARQYEVPLLVSTESTSTLLSSLINILNVELAPRVTRHGVFVEVYGEGILILGVQIPCTVIPVMPGRNLAVILETAAINNRQKKMGYNAAKELLARLGLEDDVGI